MGKKRIGGKKRENTAKWREERHKTTRGEEEQGKKERKERSKKKKSKEAGMGKRRRHLYDRWGEEGIEERKSEEQKR